MTFLVAGIPRVLGSLLREWWTPAGTDQRPVRCATSGIDVSFTEPCVPGEVVVLDRSTMAPLEVAAAAARRGAVVVLVSEERNTGPWRHLAVESSVAVGLLAAGALPDVVTNRINRSLTAGRGGTLVLDSSTDTLQPLAETLGELLGNSVTIESARNELLAFSPMEGTVDRVREETILRRRGQRAALTWVKNQGYFDQIRRSEQPVRVPANPQLNFTGRLAVRIVTEGEVLGIIWVTDTNRPLDERDCEVLQHGADAAAVILARQRETVQKEAEVRAEFLEDVVQGRVSPENAVVAARDMGWEIERPQQALCISIDRMEEIRVRYARQSARLQRLRRQLTELVRLETLTLDPQAVIAPRRNGVIILFSTGVDGVASALDAHRLAVNITRRVCALMGDLTVSVGVGPFITAVHHLAETVREADLAATLGESLWGGNRVTAARDLGIHRVLLVLQEHDDMIVPALQRIVAHDCQHQSEYVRTLEIYFACMGRLRSAAQQLDIHRNTLEYRMRRIEEIAGVDVTDSNHRIALELGIRLLHLKQGDAVSMYKGL